MKSKYYCCLFFNFEELQEELKNVKNSYDAEVIVKSLEARLCPSNWIRTAYNKYFELIEKENKNAF